MDLNKLSTADKVIAASGILLLVFSFFTWFEGSVELGGNDVVVGSDSAWGFILAIVGVLVGVALAVIVVLPALGVELPDQLTGTRITLVLGSVSLVFVLLAVLVSGYTVAGVPDDAVDTSRKIGAWLGLIAAAGVLAGALLKRKEAVGGGAAPAPPTA